MSLAEVTRAVCDVYQRTNLMSTVSMLEAFPKINHIQEDPAILRDWALCVSKQIGWVSCTNICHDDVKVIKNEPDCIIVDMAVNHHLCTGDRVSAEGAEVAWISNRQAVLRHNSESEYFTGVHRYSVNHRMRIMLTKRVPGFWHCTMNVYDVSVEASRVRRSGALNSSRVFVYEHEDNQEWIRFLPDDGSSPDGIVVDKTEVVTCSGCGRQALRADTGDWTSITDDEGGIYCPDCAYDYTEYCDRCDRTVRRDDYDYANGMCCSCADEQGCSDEDNSLIKDYHDAPDFRFYGQRKAHGCVLQGWHVGHELEVGGCSKSDDEKCDYNNDTAQQILDTVDSEGHEVFFETDGSVCRGFEIITAPHTVDLDERLPVETWCSILRNRGFLSYKYGESGGGYCGHHIHVGWSHLGRTFEEQDRSLKGLYILFDLYWDDLVKASLRVDTNYCARISVFDKSVFLRAPYRQDWPFEENLRHNEGFARDHLAAISRAYRKANLRAGGHHLCLNAESSSTFEFRLGRGTLNPASLRAWTDLCLTFCRNARNVVSVTQFFESSFWLNGIKDSTKTFLIQRRAFLDTPSIHNFAVSRGFMNTVTGEVLLAAEPEI